MHSIVAQDLEVAMSILRPKDAIAIATGRAVSRPYLGDANDDAARYNSQTPLDVENRMVYAKDLCGEWIAATELDRHVKENTDVGEQEPRIKGGISLVMWIALCWFGCKVLATVEDEDQKNMDIFMKQESRLAAVYCCVAYGSSHYQGPQAMLDLQLIARCFHNDSYTEWVLEAWRMYRYALVLRDFHRRQVE